MRPAKKGFATSGHSVTRCFGCIGTFNISTKNSSSKIVWNLPRRGLPPVASVTRSTSWAGKLCWSVCKDNTNTTQIQHKYNTNTNTPWANCVGVSQQRQYKLLTSKKITWQKDHSAILWIEFGEHYVYLCHPVGDEVVSADGVGIPFFVFVFYFNLFYYFLGIPEDTLKWKSPEKCPITPAGLWQ